MVVWRNWLAQSSDTRKVHGSNPCMTTTLPGMGKPLRVVRAPNGRVYIRRNGDAP